MDFDSLYTEYKPRFMIIANSFLHDRSLAEDLVTDSFVYFWENRDDISSSANNIPAYILGIVRHKCLDALRERQSRLTTEKKLSEIAYRENRANLSALEDCDLAQILFKEDIEKIFRRSLEKMPQLTADIFIASRFENQTYQEIAERYNVSVRKVTREIQNSLKLLREDLGDYLPIVLFYAPFFFHK